MIQKIRNISALVISQDIEIKEDLLRVLHTLKIQNITTEHPDRALACVTQTAFDIIILIVPDDTVNGADFVTSIRDKNSASPNVKTPLIINAPQSLPLDYEALRHAGCTDILLSPFSFDDLKTRLQYILENHPHHGDIPVPKDIESIKTATSTDTLSPKEDQDLVHTLLDHYLQHHEAVLRKLEFAQSATINCAKELENLREALKGKDNTSLANFSRFETMWTDIINAFIKGGISEDDLFKIEGLIADIPSDIKKHYDQLTQQDKSFLALVKTLNHNAYRKARSVAFTVQQRPNPLTGLSAKDYKQMQSNDDQDSFSDDLIDETLLDDDMAFIFSPMSQT